MKLLINTSILVVLLLICSLGYGQTCALKINDSNPLPATDYSATIALFINDNGNIYQVGSTLVVNPPLNPNSVNYITLPWTPAISVLDPNNFILYVTVTRNGTLYSPFFSQWFSGSYYYNNNINVTATV